MEDETPVTPPPRRRIVVRSCTAVIAGVAVAAGLVWSLASYGNLEEPRGLFASLRGNTTVVFPDSDKKMEELTKRELAKLGAALDDIQPAAGEPNKKSAPHP